MNPLDSLSERVLVLAPRGRDSAVAVSVLREAHLATHVCADVLALIAAMREGAGLAVITQEALVTVDLAALARWIGEQPSWSDFPFLLMVVRAVGVERSPETDRLARVLGNVSFIERPFHPTTLLSGVHSAIRARRRQYEARERMESLREMNETLETRVEERAAELEAAQDQLRQSQKMEAIGQLTGGLAHDFNNLLQGITGSLGLLRRRVNRGQTDNLDRLVEGALSAANRAAALTHRLLAFSRRQPLDPKPFDANPLIIGMADLLRRSLGERVALDFKLTPGTAITLCDPNQLESAILNLCINSRDAMPDGGTITITTAPARVTGADSYRMRPLQAGDYVLIAVTDTGKGMDAKVLERAFDPFFTTKAIGHGTGLGLSMIHGFARQSDGNVTIHSELGKGTVVELYLPAAKELGAEESAQVIADDSPAGAETVLVVEDDPIVRGLLVQVLNELSCHTLEATDGPSGLNILLSDTPIGLLVTDIGLPGLNGRQVADAGRQRRPDLKVLFITGYAENAAGSHGFLESGMAMLTKPFPMETFANKIKEMIPAQTTAAVHAATPSC